MPRSFSRHIRLVAIIVCLLLIYLAGNFSYLSIAIAKQKKTIILAWVVYCVFFYFPCLWQSSSYRKKKY